MNNGHRQRIIAAAFAVVLVSASFVSAARADHRSDESRYGRYDDSYGRGPVWREAIDRIDRATRNDRYDRDERDDRYDRGRGGYGSRERRGSSAYYFVDPWNGDRYSSLSEYRAQCRGHWPIAHVINARTGSCERTVAWHDGGWHNYDTSDPPWGRHRGGYRGGDRGYDRDDDRDYDRGHKRDGHKGRRGRD